ncbi:DUF1003 domain-containing protein [Mucilaginibacter sp. PAMB04274]|uniref:DUF1003 domain-containing protein n=1 Tax=Mucilaginibacter sp. PAMB04274 TaxID=3138568 RepID=UPI0031F6CA0C
MELNNHQSKKSNDQQKDDLLKSSLNFTKTPADHLAVYIINVLGSMVFLLFCVITFTVWICWNLNIIPGLKPFDPFPFSTLEMSVSIFAVILSVSVLINQNRQGRIEKVRQQVEFEVNVRAEHEITKILALVHDMHQKMGLKMPEDDELEQMKKKTDIREIQQSVNEQQIDTESIKTDK